MKRGFAVVIAALALAGCSQQEEGTGSRSANETGSNIQRSAQGMGTMLSNEAAGAATTISSNLPSTNTMKPTLPESGGAPNPSQ